jgi:flagellar basal body-associated protein FliL
MRKILIIIVGGFFLATAGGFAIMQQLSLGPFAKEPELTAAQKAAIPPIYVSLEPLLIPVFRGDIVAAIIKFQVQLATKSDNEATVKKHSPRLVDAFIRDLHSYVPRLLRKKKKLTLDLGVLSRRLMIVGERTIGKGIIVNVLVESGMKP